MIFLNHGTLLSDGRDAGALIPKWKPQMTRMARIKNRLRKLATGRIGSPTEFWKALPIRVIREIRGFNSGVRINTEL